MAVDEMVAQTTDIGFAMSIVRNGGRAARRGWNATGMFIYYVPAASYPANRGAMTSHFGEGAMVPYNDYLALLGSDGQVSTWAPSVRDALADDWFDVDRADQEAKFARMDAEMQPAFAHQAPAPQIATPEGMTRFIGTKIVDATPMTRLAYNVLRGWPLPADEDGADEGYLVQYTDGGKPNLEGYAGYVSWSPKEQFDQAYRAL